MFAILMPLTMPNYHNFALRPDSVFHSGGSQQASDGTDMGANITAIDTAQTQNLFVCPISCIGPGPFRDDAGSTPPPGPATTAPVLTMFTKNWWKNFFKDVKDEKTMAQFGGSK